MLLLCIAIAPLIAETFTEESGWQTGITEKETGMYALTVQASKRINAAGNLLILEESENLNENQKPWELKERTFRRFPFPQDCRDCFVDFEIQSRSVWIRLELVGAEKSVSDWFVEIAFPNLAEVDYYEFRNGILKNYYYGGTRKPFYERPVLSPNFVYPVTLEEKERAVIYFRVRTPGFLKTPVFVSDKDTYHDYHIKEQLWYGLYFGAVLALLMYNAFVYVRFREVSYLLYVLFGLSFLWLQAGISGIGYQYIWPGSVWMHRFFYPLSVYLTLMFFVLFTGYFLQSPAERRKDRKILFTLAGFLGAMFLMSFVLPTEISFGVSYPSIGVVFIYSVFISGRELIRKNRSAGYYVTAFSLLLISALAMTFRALQWLPSHFIFDNSLYFGSLAELLLLSFALGDRFYHIQMNRELIEQKAKTRSLFFSAIGHDLRQPLGVISGYAHHLSENPPRDEIVEISSKIQNAADTLETLLGDVLDLDRLDRGDVRTDLSEMVVERDIFTPLRNLFNGPASKKGLSLEFRLEDSGAFLADRARVLRILMNLVSNSVKYTNEGGIVISFRTVFEETLTGVFSVKDTGIGISQSDLKLIFKEYTRVITGRNKEQAGVGLGLTIVSRLVELLNGSIEVNSMPEEGSDFTVKIPLQEYDPEYRTADSVFEAETEKSERNLFGLKVLVVDDDEDQVRLIRKILQNWNAIILTATNRSGIKKCLENDEPHAALLDWHIGDALGLSIASELWEQFPDLPVFFISGEARLSDRDFPENVRAVFTKPVKLNNLYHELRAVLNRPQADVKQ